jgi:hypothetical protein
MTGNQIQSKTNLLIPKAEHSVVGCPLCLGPSHPCRCREVQACDLQSGYEATSLLEIHSQVQRSTWKECVSRVTVPAGVRLSLAVSGAGSEVTISSCLSPLLFLASGQSSGLWLALCASPGGLWEIHCNVNIYIGK